MRPNTRHTPAGDDSCRHAVSRLMVAVLFTALLAASLPARSGDERRSAIDPDAGKRFSSVLDGLAFEGRIGQRGEKESFVDDVWVFEDGMFASTECRKCGFPKGEYWVRFAEDGIHFRTETVCPVTDAALVYEGVVKGDRIEATYTWTKERWYWDIEKKFWFEGELVGPANVAASEPD